MNIRVAGCILQIFLDLLTLANFICVVYVKFVKTTLMVVKFVVLSTAITVEFHATKKYAKTH